MGRRKATGRNGGRDLRGAAESPGPSAALRAEEAGRSFLQGLNRVQPKYTLISDFGRRSSFCYFKPSSLWSLGMYTLPGQSHICHL